MVDIGGRTENKFREYVKKKYNSCYIQKLPDYSNTGNYAQAIGDYLIIKKGYAVIVDVKHCNNKTSFPLSNIAEHQITSLKNIFEVGNANAYFCIHMNKRFFNLHIKDLLIFLESNSRKSIPIEILQGIHQELEFASLRREVYKGKDQRLLHDCDELRPTVVKLQSIVEKLKS